MADYNETEPLLSVNRFSKPIVLSGTDAMIVRIIRLILMEPGTIQTHPDMGVGIVSRFRYSTALDQSELENAIMSQVTKYLPMYSFTKVAIEIDNKSKSIRIYLTDDQRTIAIPTIDYEKGIVLDDMKVWYFKEE